MEELKKYLGQAQLTDEARKQLWEETGPIEIKLIDKNGQCPHNLADKFIFATPSKRPDGVCPDLLRVLDAYIWRVALGFPSWEADDRRVYRIHCPSKKGTVWEMKRHS